MSALEDNVAEILFIVCKDIKELDCTGIMKIVGSAYDLEHY